MFGETRWKSFRSCRCEPVSELTNHKDILIPMQPFLNRLRSLLVRVLQCAFPDNRNAPAESVEHLHLVSVTSKVFLEFLPPEVAVRSGSSCVAATLMSVPEATMYEYHRPVLWEYKVRGSGQSPHMESISKTPCEKKGAKYQFWPSVLSANIRHHAAALQCGRDKHGLECLLPECLQKWWPRAFALKYEWERMRSQTSSWDLSCA